MTLTALTSALRHGLSFWDGLIWAAARHHRLSTIYTEDFQHDREVEGVRFLNPFVA
jgi:predicted nucleic acid-binding protein